jgi:menaquinone-dependent protoporphyrinogen oxidase
MSSPLRTLVVHASAHGSTREVAEAVASTLRERDLDVDVRPARDLPALDGYDAVVIGAALYMGRLHADARRFLKRRHGELALRRVAIFAMGPGTLEPHDIESSRKQLQRSLARLPDVEPAAAAVFGGVVDPAQLSFPFNRMPASDARDWEAIREWAEALPDLLGATLVATPTT